MPRMTLDLKDMDFFIERLNEMNANTKGIVKQGMYDGAKIMADELRTAVDGLERLPDVYLANAVRESGGSSSGKKARLGARINAGKNNEPMPLAVKQKNGLRNGLGIAKFRVEGNKITTVIGFQGYNTLVSRRWSKGQPNAMIAAACESGASFMKRQPFIRPTFTANSARVRAAISDFIIAKYREILEQR